MKKIIRWVSPWFAPKNDYIKIISIKIGGKEMPIPGDNGNPMLEKKQQEERITKVAETGACVQKEVKFNPPEPKEKCIFGEI